MKMYMPRATAIWLIDNTRLTFEQIADATGLHLLEVQALADGESVMRGSDPILNGQLTHEEIIRCEADPLARIQVKPKKYRALSKKTKKYIPLSKRSERANAIAWLIKKYPDLPDTKIARLVVSTKRTVELIRMKQASSQAIASESPITLGLCTQAEIDEACRKSGIGKNIN